MAVRARTGKKPSAAMVTRVKARQKADAKKKSAAAAKSKAAAAERKKREATLDDPAALTTPLTPRSLNAQVTAAADLYAGPAEQEVAGQRAVHGAMSQAIPAWYKDYVAARTQAFDRTKAAYGAAIGVQQNAAVTGSALDEQQRAVTNQQHQADAALRGATVDPAVAAVGQQAAASRRATLDAQTGLTAGLGAADTSYRASQVATGVGQGVRAMEQEATRGRNIAREGARIAIQKGQFAVGHRQKLIDAEHTKQLENKAFGLDVAEAEAKVVSDAAELTFKEKEARRKQGNEEAKIAVSQGQLAVAQQRAATYAEKQKKTGKPLTAAQRNLAASTRDDIEYAKRKIEQLINAKVPVYDKDGKKVLNKDGSVKTKPANLTFKQIRDRIVTGQGIGKAVPNDIYNAAQDLRAKGYLSSTNVRILQQQRGIVIGALGYQTEHGRSRRRTPRTTHRAPAPR